MENEIAYLKTENGLIFRLTKDKLFISGPNGAETIALRSINGIGFFDLVTQYNIELSYYNSRIANAKLMASVYIILGVLFLLPTLIWGLTVILILSLPLIGFGLYKLLNIDKSAAPQLFSCVRIMINGMQRDFSFNKRNANSADVANFVARVEDTLTSFHKN